MRPCTSEVDCYPTLVDGILFNFFDSPGLQDGRQGDRGYISTMAEKCSTPSLLIYCTKLGDPIKPHEKEALGNLASAFGENVWKKFVIALTFANEVRPPRRKDRTVYFHDIMTRKKKALRVCFKELGKERVFDEKIARRIFPVGSEDEVDLPTVQNWQEEFKKNCLACCSTEDRSALVTIWWKWKPYVIALGVAGVGAVTGGSGYLGGAAIAATCKVAAAAAAAKVGGAVGGTVLGLAASGGTYLYSQKPGKDKEQPGKDNEQPGKKKRE